MSQRLDSDRPARALIWDLPTRVFHVLLAVSFLAAFAVATLVDDDSPAFAIHMLLGGVAAFLVVLRTVWGLIGTRWARFSSFAFGPRAVVAYARDALRGRDPRHAGHNPGSSWATYAILLLTIGLAASGVLMGSAGHWMKEVHEVLAYSLLGVVAIHLAGVAWYTVRHRENIALGMVDGRKAAEPAHAIASARPGAALALLVLTGVWGAGLVRSYDPATRTVAVLGRTIALGDENDGAKDKGKDHAGDAGRKRHDRDDD